MLRETTITEIIKNIIEGNVKITDNSICGNCSKCGECCTNFLPVTQKENIVLDCFSRKWNNMCCSKRIRQTIYRNRNRSRISQNKCR